MEKKSQSNQGRGIKLIADVAKYREDLVVKKDVDSYGKNDSGVPTDSTEILLKKLEEMEKDTGATGTANEESKAEVETKPE